MKDPRLTTLQRTNLRQMLQTVDGHRAGATLQEIAELVFRIESVNAVVWKTLPERDTIKRRLRDGVRFINGAYRKLLTRHRAF